MLNGYKIIDADCHVLEPIEMWETYLEPAFKQRGPSPQMEIDGEKIYFQISEALAAEGRKVILRDYNSYGIYFNRHPRR